MSDEAQSQLLQAIQAILGSDPLLQVNRLLKFESKFGGNPSSLIQKELTSAYKQLSKRTLALESMLQAQYPQLLPETLKNTTELQEFLKNVAQEQLALLKDKQFLSQKVRDLEQIQALEAAAKSDMYHALQSELDQKEEKIQNLQASLQSNELDLLEKSQSQLAALKERLHDSVDLEDRLSSLSMELEEEKVAHAALQVSFQKLSKEKETLEKRVSVYHGLEKTLQETRAQVEEKKAAHAALSAELESQKETLNTQRQELENASRSHTLQKELDCAQGLVKELQERISILGQELSQKTESLDMERGVSCSAKSELVVTKERLQESLNDSQAISLELAQLRSQYEADLQKEQAQSSAISTVLQKEKADRSNLETCLKKSKEETEAVNQAYQFLESEYQNVNEALSKKNQALLALEAELAESRNLCATLEETALGDARALKNLKHQLDLSHQSVKALEDQLFTLQKEISQEKEAVEMERSLSAAAQSELMSVKERVQALEEKIQSDSEKASLEMTRLQSQYDSNVQKEQDHLKVVEAALEIEKEARASLQALLEKSRQDMETASGYQTEYMQSLERVRSLELQLSETQSQMDHKTRALEASESAVEKLGAELRSKDENIAALLSDLSKVEGEDTLLKQAFEKEKENQDRMLSHLEDLQSKHHELQQLLMDRKQEIESLESTIERLSLELRVKDETIADLSISASKLKESHESSEKNLAEQKSALEGDLSAAKNELEVLKAQLIQKSESLETSQRTLSEMTSARDETLILLEKEKENQDRMLSHLEDLQSKHHELQQLLMDRKQEIESLESTIERLSLELRVKDETIADLSISASKLKESHESSEKDLAEQKSALEGDLAAAKNELEVLKVQLIQKSESLETAQRTLSEMTSARDETLILLEKEKENQDRMLSHLEDLQSKHHELQQLLMDRKQEIESLESTIERLSLELRVKDETIADLSISASKLKESHESSEKNLAEQKSALEGDLAAAKNELEVLKAQLIQKSESLETAQRTLSDMAIARDETLMLLETERARVSRMSNEGASLEGSQQKALKHVSDLETKIISLENRLTEMQAEMSTKESGINETRMQLGKLRQQLTESEERKSKSIQLLRNSKTRILKLESDLKAREEETAQVLEEKTILKKDLADRDQEVSQLKTEVQNLTTRIRKMTESDSKKNELLREQNLIKARLSELEGREAAFEQSKLDHERLLVDFEQMKQLNSVMREELQSWPSQVSEYKSRVDNLEDELEISRKLFETKSAENDVFKIKVSELEARIYSNLQEVKTQNDDLEALRQQVAQSKSESAERLKEVKRLESEVRHSKQASVNALKSAEGRAQELENEVEELSRLKTEILSLQAEREELVKLEQSEKKRLLELEAEMHLLKADYQKETESKETLLTDLKMRQVQLQNINRALKDEVRRLSKSGASSPNSGNSSPILSRANSQLSSKGLVHSGDVPIVSPELQKQSLSPSKPTSSFNRTGSTASMLPSEPDPEYLKAVILKFLESKDMRSQLLPVISMLLHFTPEEFRRVKDHVK